jgi:hypothetical protein
MVVDIFINYNLQVVWAPNQLLLSSGVELIILPQARSLLLLFILLQVLLEFDRLQMGRHRYGVGCVFRTTPGPALSETVLCSLLSLCGTSIARELISSSSYCN